MIRRDAVQQGTKMNEPHKQRCSAMRRCAVLLVAACAVIGPASISTAAHAEVRSVSYVSSADGVTTRSTQATVIEGSSAREERLTPGWYVCDSKVKRLNLSVVSQVHLILGDNCDLTVGSDDRGAGILVPDQSQLTIWSGVKNTGRLVANGAPFSAGIGGNGSVSLRELAGSRSGNVRITGGTVIARGGEGAAGIGGGTLQVNGHISLVWRANVRAHGGDAYESNMFTTGGGAGIGAGARAHMSNHPSRGQEGQVQVETSGFVQAIGGKASRSFGAGADIGYGGVPNSLAGGPDYSSGVSWVPTISVSEVVVGQGGAVKMKDVNQAFVTAEPVSNLVPGSTVTFQVLPNPGMKLEGAQWQDTELVSSGDGLVQLVVPRLRSKLLGSPVVFSFVEVSEHAATVQEVSERIAALPDTITSVGEADQVATITKLWLALGETERATLPALSNNRLQGAQHQAAAVNHAAIDAGVLVESAKLDWNVRLIATNVHYDSAEFESARAALIDDRLLIALADIRYIDTLTGTEVMPSDDTIGTITFSGLNLAAYEHITAVVEQNGAAARETATTLRDENLQLAGIAAGRYLLTGNNVSDGGAGRGSVEDPPESLMIALMGLIGVGALAVGGVVTRLSMRRNLRMVGK